MKTTLYLTMALMTIPLLTGCECFKVCPTVPAPPIQYARPATCYHMLREADPAEKILECYIKDIVSLEGYSKQLEKLLEPYKK